MSRSRKELILALIAALLGTPTTFAQHPESSRQFEISSITFDGNATLRRDELLAQISTKETPGFFNRFLHNSISEKLGRKNEYLNLVSLGADLKRLVTYYESHGFSNVVIDTVLAYDEENGNVDVAFKITEGYRSIIDSLSYLGLQGLPEFMWNEIRSSPRIAPGDPFNAQLLEEEVGRVLRILYNQGFPNASFVKDSSWARRFASTGNYKVQLMFSTWKYYFFGKVTIRQEVDSLRGQAPREDITDDILLTQLTYSPGKHYSTDDSVTSVGNLSRLEIFDLRRFEMRVPPIEDTALTVPTFILIRPKDRHELAPELIVSDENGSLNLGAGLGYTHRNFLGGARIFSTHLRFRTQTLKEFPDYFGKNTNAVSNVDLTFELLQPYIFTNRIKGSWSFSFILDKQKPYLQNIVRNKIGFTDRFAEFTTGFLDWTLEAVSSETNEKFQANSNDIDVLRQLRLLQNPQFNSILSFTIQRDVTNDIFSPSEGLIHSATFDEAGVLPLLLRRAFPNLPFTQFYRAILVGRWYNEVSAHRFSILALKLKGGFEDKYGESKSDTNRGIPQTHRFYAGGGNSVRGWNSRELIASGKAELGGNLTFEGSAELRTNILQGLHDGFLDKFWVVQFVDVGNVWSEVRDFRFSTFAVAAGIGIRYDTFFGPFRIDWGFRVYNPTEPSGRQWITQRKFVGQTLKEGIFHFGIGQAF
jgi:outer membrane protein assembly factor BamA